jgi:hypothetical protein
VIPRPTARAKIVVCKIVAKPIFSVWWLQEKKKNRMEFEFEFESPHDYYSIWFT